MNEEWSEWYEHSGGGCPLSLGQIYQAELACGCKPICQVNECDLRGRDWHDDAVELSCAYCGIVRDVCVKRYRIRKPKGLTILEELLETLPEEVVV